MTLSNALHSAMSGLVAAGRASGVVSANIANAMNPGYARRSLVLAANVRSGPGVLSVGVQRHADPVLIASRRASDAASASATALADFHARFETLIGKAGDPASVGLRLADFESSLIASASRPDSAQHLDTVAARARDLATFVSGAAEGLESLRSQADHTIATQIERLNRALGETRQLNARITAASSAGAEINAMLDQRQQLVDEINRMVPVNVVSRDHGQIALYSEGGAILLDGSAATLDFAPVARTAPHMTVENGLLSGLKINGVPVRTDANGAVGGGSIGALFQIRDDLSVSAQADLDTVARDLIERFEAPGLDPSRLPGQPGLFTDAGAAFDPARETGLAGRIAVNALADPTQGGESWKLRAGLGAGMPGEVGDARLLGAFAQTLSEGRAVASGRFGTGMLDAAGMSAALMSRAAQQRVLADQALGFASAARTEMNRLELERGVDTDAELQTLMLVEQAYAANARMIEAVDDMMQTLLRL